MLATEDPFGSYIERGILHSHKIYYTLVINIIKYLYLLVRGTSLNDYGNDDGQIPEI